jgi:hypothetical protein
MLLSDAYEATYQLVCGWRPSTRLVGEETLSEFHEVALNSGVRGVMLRRECEGISIGVIRVVVRRLTGGALIEDGAESE